MSDYSNVSSNTDNDSETEPDKDNNTNDNDNDNSIDDANKIRFYKPDQMSMFFNGYIYNHVVKNENGTSRWRCSACNGCALITKNGLIVREPKNDAKHIPKFCEQKFESEIQCLIK